MNYEEIAKSLIDTDELTNSLKDKKKNENKKNPFELTLPLILEPVYAGKVEDFMEEGKMYKTYRLLTLEKEGIPYDVMKLQAGDYIIPLIQEDGSIIILIIERKTVSDFLSSWLGIGKKGELRLDDQIDKMFKMGNSRYDNFRVVILIEDFYKITSRLDSNKKGIWIPFTEWLGKNVDKSGSAYTMTVKHRKRNVSPKSFYGKIKSLEEDERGISVMKCYGGNDAFSKIMKLMKSSVDKKTTQYIRGIRRKPSLKDMNKQIEFILEGFNHISGGLRTNILKVYPNLMSFFKAVITSNNYKEVNVKGVYEKQYKWIKNTLLHNYGDEMVMDDGG